MPSETTIQDFLLAVSNIAVFVTAVISWLSKRQSDRNATALAQLHECLHTAENRATLRHDENRVVGQQVNEIQTAIETLAKEHEK